jgi:hypothetical protein
MPRCRMPARLRLPAVMAALLLASAGCTQDSDQEAEPSRSPGRSAESTAPAETPVTIMGAGDIAGDEEDASATADLIREADPDAVFTTGDNA